MGILYNKLTSISDDIGNKLEKAGRVVGSAGLVLIPTLQELKEKGILKTKKIDVKEKEIIKKNKGKNMSNKKYDELVKDINAKLEKSDPKGNWGAVVDNTGYLIVSDGSDEVVEFDLTKIDDKKLKETVYKAIAEHLKENKIDNKEFITKNMCDNNFSMSNEFIINTITSPFIRNFDEEQFKLVYDSEFGPRWQDQYGTLYKQDPKKFGTDEDNVLWKSDIGKVSDRNVEDENAEEQSEETTEEGSEELGDEELDTNLGEESEGSEDGGDDLSLGDEEGGEESEEDDATATESLGQNLDKALDTINKMYNKLAKIVENQ